jgi:class 3 adenylate cyclase
MIIENSYACGAQLTAPERRMRILDTLRDLPEAGLQLLASYTHPEPTRRRFGSGGDIHRSVSPADALRLYALGFELDVSDRLVDVRTPTLVLHRLDRPMIPVRCGRDLAAALPDARFVGLPGTALNGWEEHPEAGLVAMAEFLGVPLSLSAFDQAERTLRTILFTDVVGSTELTQRLGDVQAREVMRTHDRLLRQALAGHGGREIKHTGDGLLATFDSVSRALDCTIAMQRLLSGPDAPAVAPPLRIRVGLNAGEPENVGDDVFGTAVQLAARICARAGPGEVLLSDATRQLVAGKGYRFVDAGDVELKGFTGSLRLHALIWDPH